MGDYHLMCVHPFVHHVTGKSYTKGVIITDPVEVDSLQIDKDHHFNRINPVAFTGPADEPVVKEPAPVLKK